MPSLFDELVSRRFVSIESPRAQVSDLRAVSLFSGAGGLDLGLESAGFKTLACVEVDPDCRTTLKSNRPEWNLVNGDNLIAPGDIRGVKAETVLETAQIPAHEIDLLAGGPPCQSFSNLGMRRGKDDPVNGDLYREYLRLVEALKPRALIFENVEGFNHQRHAEVRLALLEELERFGYHLTSAILNAADYGDPQVRKRFVLLASRVSTPKLPAPTHFSSLSAWERFFQAQQLPAPPFRRHRTVRDAFQDLEHWATERSDNLQMGVSPVVEARMRLLKEGQNFKALPMEIRPPCWQNGKHQGADTFGRLWWDRPSVTIRTSAYNPAKGRYIHPSEHRGLSTLEMAVLQSFPESWKFRCNHRQTLVGIGRMIGNAVPIRLATALGLAIQSSLQPSGENLIERVPSLL